MSRNSNESNLSSLVVHLSALTGLARMGRRFAARCRCWFCVAADSINAI